MGQWTNRLQELAKCARKHDGVVAVPNVNKRARTHVLVAGVARELAAATWEKLSVVPDWRAMYPDRRAYVREATPYFIGEARTTLAKMLATGIPEALKDAIQDALLRDAQLMGVERVFKPV